MVVFSLLIALYLMNLLIGLLNMHIEKDNRAAYMKEKANVLLITKFCDFSYLLYNTI